MSTPTAPATEVTVRRCTVTVVRRGGWSWGPDPRGLVDRVLEALPDLLTDRLADRLDGDGPDVEITEPVIMTVRLPPRRSPATDDSSAEISVEPPPAAAVNALELDRPPIEESFSTGPSWSPPSVADLFVELAERAELAALLALLPEESVRVYLSALIDADDGTPDPARTMVAERLAAELSRRPLPARSPASPETAPEPARPATHAGGRATGERRVWSALPFLLAGPLARVGYLDAIGPALAGLDMAEDAPLFAAALAYKVLGGTERGWRRAERDRAAAAAFAGLDAPVPEEALAGFARRVRPALPVLDGVLALAVCRGHDPSEPLLVTGVDDRLLLVDAQGMFPVAWADDVFGLLPRWRACGGPPVLVCDGPLPPACLAELAAVGIPFVTDVRPLRGDPMVRLPWRTPMWTSQDTETDLRLAAELPRHAERLRELTGALVADRRAIPLAEHADLERCVTLAASLGLATIAWTLWRDRETPDPTLALRRFADLDASIRFEPDAVRVRVPLGRRHADLLRAGLLSDVPNVVWLGGRTLTFSGG